MILTPMVIADTPPCSRPNSPVVVTNAMPPDYPDSARKLGVEHVVVLVAVIVDPVGRRVGDYIQQSSHNAAMDQAALRAARQSQYAPAYANCEPTTGTFIFRAEFNNPRTPAPSPSAIPRRSIP
jgi:TonB family protein